MAVGLEVEDQLDDLGGGDIVGPAGDVLAGAPQLGHDGVPDLVQGGVAHGLDDSDLVGVLVASVGAARGNPGIRTAAAGGESGGQDQSGQNDGNQLFHHKFLQMTHAVTGPPPCRCAV